MEKFSKEELTRLLCEIADRGLIESARHGNVGGIGNTIEDLLGIKENNLPIPNAAEWELKTYRTHSKSLTTLFHMEPSPTAFKFVPSILLPKYGWPHQEAGKKHGETEMSFRQTISCLSRSDRGFKVIVDKKEKKIMISFDATAVSDKHKAWLEGVKNKVGLGELNPQPYWGFDDIYHKAGTKLHNCFLIGCEAHQVNGLLHFKIEKIMMLQKFSLEKWIEAFEHGLILVDFDARTGHNHGTKFRFRQNKFPELYEKVTIIRG